jgi:alpha-glucosidase (family GH31 glycosyl hydrolase)
MWNEFPDDVNVYDINSQFMVGKSILFAPKGTAPTSL